ncbi:hypothetical protein MJD09_14920 [bacterium]|nr:hypothetical protein [bacterium]
MPFTLHFHHVPACSGGSHDPSCNPLGEEDACAELKDELAKWCVCTHYEPDELQSRQLELHKVTPVSIPLPHEIASVASNKRGIVSQRRITIGATRIEYADGSLQLRFHTDLLPTVTISTGTLRQEEDNQEARDMITGIDPRDLREVIASLPEVPVGNGKCQLIKRRDTPGGGWSVGCDGSCDNGRCPRNPQMWLDDEGKVGLRCACITG